jgi:hypothetical protein
METIFGTINSIERNECKTTEYYYRACDIDAFKDNCFNCYKSHIRKICELERAIKSLKNYRCAFYVMFAAWVILLIAYVLK